MRSYDMGNSQLDQTIRDLVAAAADSDNQDLISEMITTALKMHRDGATRGDLKLVNTALKEMRYSMLVFSRHTEPKVTMFGSARVTAEDPNYRMARDFAEKMVSRGWGVITGAGPGIMEAGNLGAGPDASYGVKIRLPFEAESNPHLLPERTVNFKYFFTRKLGFVKESAAFALFPGGFGTLDETFELFTLIQTGKSDLHPVVLLEAPGTDYWEPLIGFLTERLAGRGMISSPDLSLFSLHNDPDAAVEEICSFYANFHSQRYVRGRLVLRLNQAPDAATLDRLNDTYSDILVSGSIEAVDPSDVEIRDGDALDCARIGLEFDRRSFGRLRQLVGELNRLVETPERVQAPAPFGADHADREW